MGRIVLAGLALALVGWGGEPEHPFAIRMGSGEKRISGYRENGFTTVCSVDLNHLPLFDQSARFSLKDQTARQTALRTRRSLTVMAECVRELGLDLCLTADEIQFPAAIWEYLLSIIPDPDHPGRINLDDERFWLFYRTKYREVLKLAPPEVRYVMVCAGGEGVSKHPLYRGHPLRVAAYDEAYFRRMARLINETRKLVVDEGNRTLIWRTWDLGSDGFHANPEVYDKVFAGVTNRNGLVVSMKYVQTDFWMYTDPNPCIGRGGLRQMVEFQSGREFEGRGAFPNYLGLEYGPAIRSALAKGVEGIWVWGGQTGGPAGPAVKSELWRQLNSVTTMDLAAHPQKTPEAAATAWCEKVFGKQAASAVSAILMKSHDCVTKVFYIEAYGLLHKGWMPNRNLVRDDLIRGDRQMGDEGGIHLIYNDIKEELGDALIEKREAVEIAFSLRESFERQRDAIIREKGQKVYEEALTGFICLEKIAKVMCHYIRGIFLYYTWLEVNEDEAAVAAFHELTLWKHAWEEYQTVAPTLPAAPGLFRSLCTPDETSSAGAMADTCGRAMEELQERVKAYREKQAAETAAEAKKGQ
ncbi:MAG: hypothetical protein J6334_04585 [Kiritimatiellae bacterium]|nr:hypothetical protein [Kiritimatiellia bacterium]